MIKADISDGKFILYNTLPDLAGIEISHAGNIYINPTLPDGWILRASKKKILIFNMGTNILENGHQLFTYEGTFNFRNMMGATKTAERVNMSCLNSKRNWDNNYHSVTELGYMTENWDAIENKNVSKITNYKATEPNRGIVNIPTLNSQHTKGKEYMLNGKEYIGYYHVHKDINVAMTGKRHEHSSKILSEYSETKPIPKTRVTQTKKISDTGGY